MVVQVGPLGATPRAQGSFGEDKYTVGSAAFPVLDIQEEEFRGVLARLGLETVRCPGCPRL
jgi:hypothetical protein